ncbi:acyl-CoA dehydrogenase NM domain-like protein [Leucogyrophana mollusca]|uniref:Acyl-CoA dehydrogenase NM domain-like protein n=1 Tax=Leucogyrophana mollusca TaxID=85980 RepID=A0ACB8B8H4_9AGAM|nr:acyl-CoA dehydrogenase NM domain-like protein [Leucogyrophana mollusca]
MRPSASLITSELFQIRSQFHSHEARASLAYDRAKAIGLAYGITLQDTLNLSHKFWDMHTDPIIWADGAAIALITLQYNLVAGTIARHAASDRPDLLSVVSDLLAFRIIGQFCLTELGRGLDIYKMKTRATLLPSGEFDLHTPTANDAKFMSATIPVKGWPCVAVVFAQLYVDGEWRGPRPFLVNLNDGYRMSEGITAKLLPPRGGSWAFNHSLTSFNHVRLPQSAILGKLEKSLTMHSDFMASIWRIPVSTLALSLPGISSLQISSFISARYSLRRHVTGPEGKPTPIISFRSHHAPLFEAIAQSFVLHVMYKWAVRTFMDEKLDIRSRHGVAICIKVVMVQHSQVSNSTLSERMGAQGLFDYNRLTNIHFDMRGNAIEGDVLGLSTRLIRDILEYSYSVPLTSRPMSLLAQHETGLFDEAFEAISNLSNFAEGFSAFVQPNAINMVQSIGHRMAYDAAIDQDVPRCLIDLYLCSAMKTDAAWYVERGALTRKEMAQMEGNALNAAFPRLEEFLQMMEVEPYITAPVISDEHWEKFTEMLPIHSSWLGRPVRVNQGVAKL